MERLGLWGSGAPFKSFEHFLEAINRRGLGKYCNCIGIFCQCILCICNAINLNELEVRNVTRFVHFYIVGLGKFNNTFSEMCHDSWLVSSKSTRN